MRHKIDAHLEDMAARGEADRRNGSYARWLMSELGPIELEVPRTRTFSALRVVRAYPPRAPLRECGHCTARAGPPYGQPPTERREGGSILHADRGSIFDAD